MGPNHGEEAGRRWGEDTQLSSTGDENETGETDPRGGPSNQPTSTADLRPRTLLTVAEVVMIPFFWLAPLSLVVLGGAMALDLSRSRDRFEEYGLESPFDSTSYLLCAIPFVIAQLGTLVYRIVRVNKMRSSLGISQSGFNRCVSRRNPSSGRVVGVVFGFQLLSVAVLLFHPIGDWLLLIGLLAAPFAVWYDLRSVRALEYVDWGWPWILHVLLGWLPGATFVYLIKRQQQVQLAALVDVWTTDPVTLEPDPDEMTRSERFADWLDQRL
ncbi:hypothetical protein AB7C87_06940 [Natrarchaeobius sp. A-rgal3]|uniref:hypothetical protein n=1 Tax=Natrarchaeobius versutus TaxID=1679078 RepID=UPI003510044C